MLELYIMAFKKKIESIITDIVTPFASLTSNKLHHKLYMNYLQFISYNLFYYSIWDYNN